MIKVKVKKVGSSLEQLVSRLQKIRDEKAQAGFFDSSGDHPTAGMSFARLMAIHELGIGVPSRPLMMITALNSEKEIKNRILKYLPSYLEGDLKPESFLMIYSKVLFDNAMAVFGNPDVLQPNHPMTIANKGANTPLVDTEELKGAFRATTTVETA